MDKFKKSITILTSLYLAYKDLAHGRELLLIAYRTGKQPPEKAFHLIAKSNVIIHDIENDTEMVVQDGT